MVSYISDNVEQYWNFIGGLAATLRYNLISCTVWMNIALNEHIYNIINLQSLLTGACGGKHKVHAID